VWNADTRQVRYVIHDEGWITRRSCKDVDAFLEDRLYACLENVTPGDLDDWSESTDRARRYRDAVSVALEIVDDPLLDEEVREKLVALAAIGEEAVGDE